MKLAFAVFNYFPYGGMQRNFLAIARACQQRGHEVTAFVGEWQGERPQGLRVEILPWSGLANHVRARRFHRALRARLADADFDRVVGFNRMPDLDFYYAADTCFREKAAQEHGLLYRLTGRYRTYAAFEQAVYGRDGRTRILLVSASQKIHFQHWYGTPDERFLLLPPGIQRDRMATAQAPEMRASLRRELGIADNEYLLLFVGAGFRTKGLDRAIDALASLPERLRNSTRFVVVGDGNSAPYLRQAEQRGMAERITFLPGRDDIPRFLQGADALLHPAYYENTGNVILEAIVAGLPVLATAACGYAHFIGEVDCGLVHPSRFDGGLLARQLETLLTSPARERWRDNGIRFGREHDLYDRPGYAAEIIERYGSADAR